jgi:hypothetical protein
VAAQQNRTQQLVKEAGDAVRAKEVAFEQLATLRDAIEAGFTRLKKGDPKIGLPPSPPSVADQLRRAEGPGWRCAKGPTGSWQRRTASSWCLPRSMRPERC